MSTPATGTRTNTAARFRGGGCGGLCGHEKDFTCAGETPTRSGKRTGRGQGGGWGRGRGEFPCCQFQQKHRPPRQCKLSAGQMSSLAVGVEMAMERALEGGPPRHRQQKPGRQVRASGPQVAGRGGSGEAVAAAALGCSSGIGATGVAPGCVFRLFLFKSKGECGCN